MVDYYRYLLNLYLLHYFISLLKNQSKPFSQVINLENFKQIYQLDETN